MNKNLALLLAFLVITLVNTSFGIYYSTENMFLKIICLFIGAGTLGYVVGEWSYFKSKYD